MFFGVDSARGRLAPTLTAFVALSVAGCVTDFSRSGTPATTSAAGAASLAEIVETTPLDHPAREEIREGVRLLRAGSAAGANDIFERGLKRNPTDGVLHFLNGLAYHTRAENGNKSDLELAETGYQLALKFDPGNVWAAYLLGHIAYRAQRYVDAENYFAYGTLYQPDNPELLKGLLVSSYAARDLGMAAWAAKQLEPLATKDPAVRRNATLAYAASGHFDDARASLAAFAENAEGNGSLQPRYAALQRRVGEWQEYFQRNNLPQFAFSDAQPFEDRRRARENRSDQAPAPQAVPRGPVTQGPVDQRQAPADTAPGAQNRAPAGTQVVFQPEKGPRMVLVDVAIIRTEENRFSRQGVNLLSGLEATLGGTLYNLNYVTGTDAGNSVRTLTHTINPVFTLAGLTYNLNIFNDGVERAEVLARPSLLAVENKTSEFFSGGVWHVQLVSNLSYGTIEQVPIGINLKVTPQFLDEELLLVDVSAERSFLEERSAEVGFTAFSETTKTSVSATAKLRFGETLILSGLSENENNRQRDGVPVLDKVPVVQYLFSQRSEESTKRSVLILLTPRKAHFMDGLGTDAARALPPPPQGERFRTELQKRAGIRPNLDAVFAGLEYSDYYRQFRSGDMQMVRWEEHDGLDQVIKNFFQMLYF